MVLVTLGTQVEQFPRIIDYVVNSEILKNESILIQAGNTKYEKDYDKERIKITDFMQQEEFEKSVQDSSFVIAQGGVGSIFTAIKNKKKVLVVPRLKKFSEHVNDHQLEICKQLSKEGYIIYLNEDESDNYNFDLKIKMLENFKVKEYIPDTRYLEILKNEI